MFLDAGKLVDFAKTNKIPYQNVTLELRLSDVTPRPAPQPDGFTFLITKLPPSTEFDDSLLSILVGNLFDANDEHDDVHLVYRNVPGDSAVIRCSKSKGSI